MDATKQRIAIAEACPQGFDLSFGTSVAAFREWTDDRYWLGRHPLYETVIVDPINDLNAMHEAEITLDKDQLWEFASKLSCVMDNAPRRFPGMAWEAHQVSPTAAQRAEAFLRTIGKWED